VVRPDSPKPVVSNAVYIIERNVRIKIIQNKGITKGRNEECRKRRIESIREEADAEENSAPKSHEVVEYFETKGG
jgi:hypothetical protein